MSTSKHYVTNFLPQHISLPGMSHLTSYNAIQATCLLIHQTMGVDFDEIKVEGARYGDRRFMVHGQKVATISYQDLAPEAFL